jgi:mono/diheme cytochrome c family protein
MLRLRDEPVALSALGTSNGELSARVTSLLARVEWPGKPGMARPVAPLTPAETARFETGREVYRNACQSCHMPDGRGQDRVAAGLVGSSYALAPPEIPIRILLGGKDGEIGLMPPLGAMLDDDQVAAVLTYVRREWGQTASPVAPSEVATVRKATAGRPRPWTNDELQKLMPVPGTAQ